jgi:thymidylate kinase
MHLRLNISTHRPDIKILLQKGTNVIVDRYSYSGIAFSAAKPVYITRIFS